MFQRLLLLAAVAVSFAFAVRVAAQTPAPPNVLFIALDDLRPELGCYGVKDAQSPRMDRLAAEGVLFTRHYAPAPTCGVSRYAMLSGRSPVRSGVTASNEALYTGKSALTPELLAGAQSMPELFRRSGYRTVCLGKISHTPDGRVYEYDGTGDGHPELPHAWDELPTPFGPWQRGWGAFFGYQGGKHREDGQRHNALMEFTATQDNELPDGLIAKEAVSQLGALKKAGKPFFLGVGFYKPHLPFVATKGDWDAIGDVEAAPAETRQKPASPYWHNSGEFYRYQPPFPKTRPLPEAAQRQSRRAYLACVRYADRQVGRVLDALREQGLADNTIVVVWGDHGWHLGEQEIWGKHSPFEAALRSVLIVRAPGVSKAGLRSEALVESTDLYPTLIDLCRPSFKQTQHPLDGKSLRSLLSGASISVRDASVSWWKDSVSVRTDRYRLVSTRPLAAPTRVELYDLAADPIGLRDVAATEPETVRQLRAHARAREAGSASEER
jgi:arylsulfatase A-like enzyme